MQVDDSSSVDSSGMLASDPAPAAPSNVDMADPDQTQTPGFLSSIESFASAAVTGAENAVGTVYTGAKTVVGDTVGGVESVAGKAVGGVTGAVSSVTMNIVLIVAAVGVGLYFIFKTGAVKATI